MGEKLDIAEFGVGGLAQDSLLFGHAGDLALSGQSWDAVQNPFGSICGGLTLVGAGIGAGFAVANYINSKKTRKSADDLPTNQHLANGNYPPSPKTHEFLVSRADKDLAGGLSSAAGGIASAGTAGVNTLGVVKNASSAFTSSFHAHKLLNMIKNTPNNEPYYLCDALKLIMKLKRIKATSRSISTAADGLGLIPAASGTLGVTSSVMSTLAKASYERQCVEIAQFLHIAAYRYLNSLDNIHNWKQHKTDGYYAIMIVRELLTQRGISKFTKKRAKTMEYMAEPAGWMVALDKIQAM